jgi:hypothetical protein
MAYDATISVHAVAPHTPDVMEPDKLVEIIRQALPLSHRTLDFQLDMATQDPRNINPLAIGDSPIYIYDPGTGEVQAESLEEILESIPVKIVQYRLYTTDHASSQQLAQAGKTAFARCTA